MNYLLHFTREATPVFHIIDTRHFDQWHAIFNEGIVSLAQLSRAEHRGPVLTSKLSKLSTSLLNIAKSLNIFLAQAMTTLVPQQTYGHRRIELSETSWIKLVVADFRIACHRYCWACVQIAIAMEQKKMAQCQRERAAKKLSRRDYGSEIQYTIRMPTSMPIFNQQVLVEDPWSAGTGKTANTSDGWSLVGTLSSSSSMTAVNSCSEDGTSYNC